MRSMMLILLVFSGGSIWLTLNQTPAFNPQHIAETAIGDGRIIDNAAMYDPGTYAFQRGYGFLVAEAVISPETEAGEENVSSNQSDDRARLAVEALEISLDLDPGNAHAWAALAWARARLGDDTGTMDALRVSWQIAPYNRDLADSRLNLAGLLTDPEIGITEPTEADRAAIARDLEVLRRFEPQAVTYYIELSPHLAGLSSDEAQR